MINSSGGLPSIPFRDHFGRWIDAEISPCAHLGLAYDRFSPLRLDEKGEWKFDARDLKRIAVGFDTAREGLTGRLEEHHSRLQRLVEARGGLVGKFLTVGRLAIGLGADHPSENGFCLDPVLGVPYLPGSSLKGMCRAWAELTGLSSSRISELFGRHSEAGIISNEVAEDEAGTGDREAGQNGTVETVAVQPVDEEAGRLIFLSAYPARGPRVEVDMVNCHLPTWYREQTRAETVESLDRSSAIPTDNPVPASFLTVAEGTSFRIYLMSRAVSTEEREADVRSGFDIMSGALNGLGIGAKTASGYGELASEVQNVLMWVNATAKPPLKMIRRLMKEVPGRWEEPSLNPLKSDPAFVGEWGELFRKLNGLLAQVTARVPIPDRLLLHGAAPPSAYCYLGYHLASFPGEVEVVELSPGGGIRRIRFERDGQRYPSGKAAGSLMGEMNMNRYLALCISETGQEPDLDILEAVARDQGVELADFDTLEAEPGHLEKNGLGEIARLRRFLIETFEREGPNTGYFLMVSGSDALAFAVGRAAGHVAVIQPGRRIQLALSQEGADRSCIELRRDDSPVQCLGVSADEG